MKFICATAASLILATSNSALAGVYQAMCGDLRCQIDVSPRGISSPAGFMPSGLVWQWASGRSSDFNAGGAFKSFFTIVGYNDEGNKMSHFFYIDNDKSTQRLLVELPLVTGLAESQKRTLKDIEKAFARGDLQVSTGSDLPSKLGLPAGQSPTNTKPVDKKVTATKSLTQKKKCKDGKKKLKTDYGKICPEDLTKHQRRMEGLGRMTRPG